MAELGKTAKNKDVSLETKAKIIHTTHRCKSWTVKKPDSETFDSFEIWCWRRHLYRYLDHQKEE